MSDLSKNPLLLNIIVKLHSYYSGERLPKRRIDLYAEICRIQLGDRPLVKKIDMLLESKDSQKILQELALYMVQSNQSQIAHGVTNKLKSRQGVGCWVLGRIEPSKSLIEHEGCTQQVSTYVFSPLFGCHYFVSYFIFYNQLYSPVIILYPLFFFVIEPIFSIAIVGLGSYHNCLPHHIEWIQKILRIIYTFSLKH